MSIMNSLSKDAKHHIGVWSDDYTIEGEIYAILLLKVIIRESRGDTNHRKLVLRQQLSSLDTKIEDLGWSITQLHTHVKDVLDDLTALGQETHDLLANLFKAYARVPDDEFVLYMNTKRQKYDEGTDYTPAQIMIYAGDKYKQRVEDKSWTAPSKEQQQIVTMQAKLEKLEKKKNTTTSTKVTANHTNNNGPQRAEWQMIKPTSKEIAANYTKKVNGKVFKWCDKHGFWSKHSTEQCRLTEKKEDADVKPAAKQNGMTNKQEAKKAKLTQALAAMHEEHEVSDEEDDDE
jgi:hypothetical protein